MSLLAGVTAQSAYAVATGYLAARGRLPLRLLSFLDDMHRLGILRSVGPIYQFRHEVFRTWLVARATAPRDPLR